MRMQTQVSGRRETKYLRIKQEAGGGDEDENPGEGEEKDSNAYGLCKMLCSTFVHP